MHCWRICVPLRPLAHLPPAPRGGMAVVKSNGCHCLKAVQRRWGKGCGWQARQHWGRYWWQRTNPEPPWSRPQWNHWYPGVSCPEPRASYQLPSNYIEVLNRGSVMRRSLEKFHVIHCRDWEKDIRAIDNFLKQNITLTLIHNQPMILKLLGWFDECKWLYKL